MDGYQPRSQPNKESVNGNERQDAEKQLSSAKDLIKAIKLWEKVVKRILQ